MKASEVLFVGIGQGGNNLTDDVYNSNKRLNTFYINTTEDDLKGFDAKFKHIFTGGQGSAKDRDLAQSYARNEIRHVADKINEFKEVKYVFISFAMGGGTGSGIAPLLADMLTSIREDLNVILVGITSFAHESIRTHKNVVECWNEIIELENVGILLIDNNKRKTKAEINKEFVRLFNLMLNMNEEYHRDGVIDLSEIGLMASGIGMMGIYDLSEYGKLDIATIMKESIFAGVGIDCEYLGLTLPEKVDRSKILDVFNARLDVFQGYNQKNPLLFVSGSPITSKPIVKIQKMAQEKINNYNAKIMDQFEEDAAVDGLDGFDSFINSKPKRKSRTIEDIEEKSGTKKRTSNKNESENKNKKGKSWADLLK